MNKWEREGRERKGSDRWLSGVNGRVEGECVNAKREGVRK